MINISLKLGNLGAWFIVKHPTGVLYDIQCGGNFCYHKQVEGYLVLGDRELGDWLEDSVETYGSFTEEDKELISYKLNNYTPWDYKLISFELENALESYIPCKISIGNSGELDCILTWENCD